MTSFSDFEKFEIRVGTILEVKDFPNAKNPSYKLWIDFGNFGIKKSAAQITDLYSQEFLVGKQIIGIVNLPSKQIADFISEVLILGVYGKNKEVILLQPERSIENGSKIG